MELSYKRHVLRRRRFCSSTVITTDSQRQSQRLFAQLRHQRNAPGSTQWVGERIESDHRNSLLGGGNGYVKASACSSHLGVLRTMDKGLEQTRQVMIMMATISSSVKLQLETFQRLLHKLYLNRFFNLQIVKAKYN